VLIDLDLQFGTSAYDLDIKSDGGVLEALRNPNRIDSVFLDALVTRHTSGLDILPSPADMSSWDGINPQALSRLVKVLSAKYDHVVFSLPMLMNEVIEQVLSLSNPVYLVTQDTISMLRNLNMMLQRLPKRGIPTRNIEVIQNRVRDVPLHKVRSDYKLAARAENEGKTIGELSPRTGMVKDLINIAEHIVMYDSESVEPATRPAKRWFS
jgi:pilus assembly protein CpaE